MIFLCVFAFWLGATLILATLVGWCAEQREIGDQIARWRLDPENFETP